MERITLDKTEALLLKNLLEIYLDEPIGGDENTAEAILKKITDAFGLLVDRQF